MSAATLTPDAKLALARTIRKLRARLLADLRAAAESAYHLAVPLDQAGLDEAHSVRRRRLEGWLDERARNSGARGAKDLAAARDRFLRLAENEAAATLVNRLVLVRQLEALGMSWPHVVTGGWNSRGYREFREHAPALLGDETEGYAALLQLLFDDLALELPGLFGDVGTTKLFPVPPATLREVVEQLDLPELASAWTDDTTLGWVYQYWNDPERERIDGELARGGKVEPHEIASKTQMFTERYMVEWLLHNSLGLTWLAMCRRLGRTADAEGVLLALDARRAEWREKREAGEVAQDALMPVEEGLEDRWKLFVPQAIPEGVARDRTSVRELKILDPACGSGHFLVIAFDLLAALYEEEARHCGLAWSKKEIAESILENNLHGVDIDPRAVQIAAAALFLKARALAKDARPKRLNLVAPVLNLGHLPDKDPALLRLRDEMREEAGIPDVLTDKIVTALADVDHLGTLLRVDAAVEGAIKACEVEVEENGQGNLFPVQQVKLGFEKTKATVLEKLEAFLGRHAWAEDLGLRLDGEQVAAGLRFLRIVKEETYDLVVGNPPYLGTPKLVDADYVKKKYPNGKADLYGAFLERGLELTRPGGLSALLTMRGWMFLGQFTELRKNLLDSYDLRSLGDMDRGAFDEVPNEVLAVTMSVFRRAAPASELSVAIQPTPLSDKSYDRERTARKRAAVLAQVGRCEFQTSRFKAIEGEPVVYWWSRNMLAEYEGARKLGELAPIRYGLSTQNNTRWLRKVWEIGHCDVMARGFDEPPGWDGRPWVPYIKGAEGRQWFDAVSDVLLWRDAGLELATYPGNRYGRGTAFYFRQGVAFVNIGLSFSARVHRKQSIFGHVAGSVFGVDIPSTLCMLNSSRARFIMESLNPGVHFLTTDVERLPLFKIADADAIYASLDRAFTEHECARETSVEFVAPGASPWRYAQDWAQRAVDRPAGASLPPYEPVLDPPPREAFVSFAFGLAISRFPLQAAGPNPQASGTGLPHGILYLSAASERDSLVDSACRPLHAAWAEHAVDPKLDLRTWLRTRFFACHRDLYENRPIYLPLSSAKRSFVAWVSIHRWTESTLQTILADHLIPEQRAIDGEIADLNKARAFGNEAGRGKAEKRYAEIQRLKVELDAFVAAVSEIASKGPPPADDRSRRREVDAPFAMDLDDGVKVNSAALWPLLEPQQWKDPRKWWREIADAEGDKDHDWTHLAARYFPTRVEAKCAKDPSLAVAHGCFWRLHPFIAYKWELRLRYEIGDDFRIKEKDADERRRAFEKAHKAAVRKLKAAEKKRWLRKAERLDLEDDEQGDLPFPDEEVEEAGSDA